MTALLNIGGIDMPTPSVYTPGIQDISQAARNANGTMIIERIATKRKLDLSWLFLTPAQLSTLLNAVSGVSFTVIYMDPQLNANRTATFYCGDRSVDMIDFQGGVPRYHGIKFSLIEI